MVVSEFQLALIGAGAVAVAGVWGYNLWQERRHRRLADKVFKGSQPDALLPGGENVAEPVAAAVAAVPGAADRGRIEPTFGEPAGPPVVAEEPAVAPGRADVQTAAAAVPEFPLQWADALSDCLVRFEFAQAVEPATLIAQRDAGVGQVAKAEHWLVAAEVAGPWRLLESNDRSAIRHGVAALQLADRRGALQGDALAAFVSRVEAGIAELGGKADLPDAARVLQQAAALDAFCASVDVQLGISLVGGGGTPIPGTRLRGLCEAAGLRLVPEGYFLMRDAAGCDRFTGVELGGAAIDGERLRNGTLAGLTLTLDVPRTADGVAAFELMLATANQLAGSLGASLVDGQRAPLSEAMIAAIRAKIGELQQQMRGQGIVPGGTRALRLFA